MTPLMHAALLGNRELVHALIVRGAEVNAVDSNGMTALMQASWAGHIEVVEDLPDAGASVNLRISSRTIRTHPKRRKRSHLRCHPVAMSKWLNCC